MTRRQLMDFEQRIAMALTSAVPAMSFESLVDDERIPADLRARVAEADIDGFLITSLLVARLRFERLMQGSRRASEWFESDPAAFAAAFRRYHSEVDPIAGMPATEAELFEDWLEDQAE